MSEKIDNKKDINHIKIDFGKVKKGVVVRPEVNNYIEQKKQEINIQIQGFRNILDKKIEQADSVKEKEDIEKKWKEYLKTIQTVFTKWCKQAKNVDGPAMQDRFEQSYATVNESLNGVFDEIENFQLNETLRQDSKEHFSQSKLDKLLTSLNENEGLEPRETSVRKFNEILSQSELDRLLNKEETSLQSKVDEEIDEYAEKAKKDAPKSVEKIEETTTAAHQSGAEITLESKGQLDQVKSEIVEFDNFDHVEKDSESTFDQSHMVKTPETKKDHNNIDKQKIIRSIIDKINFKKNTVIRIDKEALEKLNKLGKNLTNQQKAEKKDLIKRIRESRENIERLEKELEQVQGTAIHLDNKKENANDNQELFKQADELVDIKIKEIKDSEMPDNIKDILVRKIINDLNNFKNIVKDKKIEGLNNVINEDLNGVLGRFNNMSNMKRLSQHERLQAMVDHKALSDYIKSQKSSVDEKEKVVLPTVISEEDLRKEGAAEENFEEARKTYHELYKAHLNETRPKGKWDKLKTMVGGRKAEVDPESDLAKAKEKYNEYRKAYAEELKKNGEIDKIVNELLIGEMKKLQELNIENYPPQEKGIIKKVWEWYLKKDRATKLIVSTALVTGAAAGLSGLGLISLGSIPAFAAYRFIRGGVSMVAGMASGKLINNLYTKKIDKNYNKGIDSIQDKLNEENIDFDQIGREYEKIFDFKNNQEKKKVFFNILATVAGGALTMAGASYAEATYSGGVKAPAQPESFKKDMVEQVKETPIGKDMPERVREVAAANNQTESVNSIEPNDQKIKYATIQKGQGVEHAFKNQLINNPKNFGFSGDFNDKAAIAKWAGIKAHQIAIENNYVDSVREIRVGTDGIGRAAYVLEMGKDGEFEVKEYFQEKPNGKFISQDSGYVQDYEYEHSGIGKGKGADLDDNRTGGKKPIAAKVPGGSVPPNIESFDSTMKGFDKYRMFSQELRLSLDIEKINNDIVGLKNNSIADFRKMTGFSPEQYNAIKGMKVGDIIKSTDSLVTNEDIRMNSLISKLRIGVHVMDDEENLANRLREIKRFSVDADPNQTLEDYLTHKDGKVGELEDRLNSLKNEHEKISKALKEADASKSSKDIVDNKPKVEEVKEIKTDSQPEKIVEEKPDAHKAVDKEPVVEKKNLNTEPEKVKADDAKPVQNKGVNEPENAKEIKKIYTTDEPAKTGKENLVTDEPKQEKKITKEEQFTKTIEKNQISLKNFQEISRSVDVAPGIKISEIKPDNVKDIAQRISTSDGRKDFQEMLKSIAKDGKINENLQKEINNYLDNPEERIKNISKESGKTVNLISPNVRHSGFLKNLIRAVVDGKASIRPTITKL